jgi:alpha-D-ribose 1-methylphosphonate 5-triphosphate diphosphatase
LPWDLALASAEQRLRAAGVTTVFRGAAFDDGGSPISHRSVAAALELCATVAARWEAAVDHRILHRLDVRDAGGHAALPRQVRAGRCRSVLRATG